MELYLTIIKVEDMFYPQVINFQKMKGYYEFEEILKSVNKPPNI